MPNITNTTIAGHYRCRQKWPPSAPYEALRSAPAHRMDRRHPPEQVDILFGAALKTLQCCGNSSSPERFEGHTHPQPPPKLHPLAWGVVNYSFEVLVRSARPHVGR
jgi:hypothetical protein